MLALYMWIHIEGMPIQTKDLRNSYEVNVIIEFNVERDQSWVLKRQ